MLMISTLLANPKLLFMQQSHRCLLGMVPCYQLESAIPSKHLWWLQIYMAALDPPLIKLVQTTASTSYQGRSEEQKSTLDWTDANRVTYVPLKQVEIKNSLQRRLLPYF